MATAVTPEAMKRALGRYPTGVTVVTTQGPEGPVGLTVNSFTSVSMDPPLILWCLGSQSPNLEAFRASEYFAVNILAADQAALCSHFAAPATERFQGVDWWAGTGGVPLLKGVVARLVCRQYRRDAGGDHEIFLGEVVEIEAAADDPLVYLAGGFRVAVDRRGSAATG